MKLEMIDKAQAVLNNKNFSDAMIADQIGVRRMMIHRYRDGTTELINAKYSIVKALADEYDKNEIAMIDMTNSGAFKFFLTRMQSFFNEVKQDQADSYDSPAANVDDLALIPVLDRINREISNNTSLMIDLYHIYYKNLNKEIDK